jgi:hypothetical protein
MDLPFEMAFFPPDRSIADGYASMADWMNLYFTMLDELGFDPQFVLGAMDCVTYPEMARARRAVPQTGDFSNLLIRAKVRKGGWLFGLFGGEEKEYVLAYENEYTPLGVRTADGRGGRTENFMSIDLNASGAARITVSNSTWGISVAALRKTYSEMLPEMRSRNHTELVGEIAESAEAVSELVTDTQGYPFVLSYSVYAPNYAAKNADTLTFVVPRLGGKFLPDGELDRKTPFGIGARLSTGVFIREVLFPEGYTETEYMPPSWEIALPGDEGGRIRFSAETSFVGKRLKMVFREEHFPTGALMFPKEWSGFFRDWNRRTGSRLSRTVVVRKNRP